MGRQDGEAPQRRRDGTGRHGSESEEQTTKGPADVGQLLFDSDEASKVRMVTWFLFVVMLGSLYTARLIYWYMIEGGGSTELAPFGLRLGMALAVGGVGLAMFLPMLLYLRLYAVRVVLVPERRCLRVTTMRLFGTRSRDVPLDAVMKTEYHHGRMRIRRGRGVNAPWYWVRVKGGGSFLMDAHGWFHDAAKLGHLLGLEIR